jgi:hypothetical protein
VAGARGVRALADFRLLRQAHLRLDAAREADARNLG